MQILLASFSLSLPLSPFFSPLSKFTSEQFHLFKEKSSRSVICLEEIYCLTCKAGISLRKTFWFNAIIFKWIVTLQSFWYQATIIFLSSCPLWKTFALLFTDGKNRSVIFDITNGAARKDLIVCPWKFISHKRAHCKRLIRIQVKTVSSQTCVLLGAGMGRREAA